MVSIRKGSSSLILLAFGLWVFLGFMGCVRPGTPLNMETQDPAQDHWRIAALYSQEAASLRQRAEELINRAATYEQIFGANSEWVTGARLLAQFYENAARDRERQAALHLDLAGQRSPIGAGISGMR